MIDGVLQRTQEQPRTEYYLAATLAAGLAFVLLMVIMRGLLLSAIADRSELDEVI